MSFKNILFLYPDPPGFSGQRNVAEQILRGFDGQTSYQIFPLKLPGLPKTRGKIVKSILTLTFSIRMLVALVFLSIFRSPEGVYVSLSQTSRTLRRERLLVGLIRFLSRNSSLPVIAKLDSSLCTQWQGSEQVARQFVDFLTQVQVLIVLGPRQQKKIAELSSDSTDVRIVVNTCDIPCVSEQEVRQKHLKGQNSSQKIRVLHLSSLMEPKGYRALIEAIDLLNENIEVTVCGRLTQTIYDTEFATIEQARQRLLLDIQQYPNLRWVDGAVGKAKSDLLKSADIFVLPTSYPVEAQPLVLLEAMASGCAVVTTGVGEIPVVATPNNAWILSTDDRCEIANAINRLADDSELRCRLASRGLTDFQTKFSVEKNIDAWKDIFDQYF